MSKFATSIVSCLFILTLLSPCAMAATHSAGVVIQLIPPAWIERGSEKILLNMKSEVASGDMVFTGHGAKLQILFTDDSILAMGPTTKVGVDDFVFDHDKEIGEMAISIGEGVMRMVSGKIVEANPEAFSIETPLSSIGIRGTMTGHVVQGNMENHVTMHITGDHEVAVQSRAGGPPQIMTLSMQQVNVASGAPAGDVQQADPAIVDNINSATTASPEEQEEASTASGHDTDGNDGDDQGDDTEDSNNSNDNEGNNTNSDNADDGGNQSDNEAGDTDGFAAETIDTTTQSQQSGDTTQTDNPQSYTTEVQNQVQNSINSDRTNETDTSTGTETTQVWFNEMWGSDFLYYPLGEEYTDNDTFDVATPQTYTFTQKNGASGSFDMVWGYFPSISLTSLSHEDFDGTICSWSSSGDPIQYEYSADTSYLQNGEKYLELGWWDVVGSDTVTASLSTGGTGTLTIPSLSIALMQKTTSDQYAASTFPTTSEGTYTGKVLAMAFYTNHNSGLPQKIEGELQSIVNFSTSTVEDSVISFENLGMSGFESIQFIQKDDSALEYYSDGAYYSAEISANPGSSEAEIWYTLDGAAYQGEGWMDLLLSGELGQGVGGSGEFQGQDGHDLFISMALAAETTSSGAWTGSSATMVSSTASGSSVSHGYVGTLPIFGLTQDETGGTGRISVIRDGSDDIYIAYVQRDGRYGESHTYAPQNLSDMVHMTYTQDGTAQDADGNTYMQWGTWNVEGADPMLASTGHMSMAPILDVEGYRTDDLSSTFSQLVNAGTTTGSYSGTARALFQAHDDLANHTIMNGSFSTEVDFNASTMSNLNIHFNPDQAQGLYGMTIQQVGTVSLSGGGQNHFSLADNLNNANGAYMEATVLSPTGGAHSNGLANMSGNVFGPNAEGIGGSFDIHTNNSDDERFTTTGTFQGTR